MCEVADSGCELKVIKSPQAFDESPEALLEVDILRERGREFIVFVVLRRQVFEDIED